MHDALGLTIEIILLVLGLALLAYGIYVQVEMKKACAKDKHPETCRAWSEVVAISSMVIGAIISLASGYLLFKRRGKRSLHSIV